MTSFADMRQGFVDRGLVCAVTGKLTDAGLAHSEKVKREVRDALPPPDEAAYFVRWNTSRAGR